MIKRISTLMLPGLLAVALFAGSASAQNLKVGYTDHELIIVNMPDYRSIQEELQKDITGGQAELQQMYQSYQEKLERYQKQQPVLSEDIRAQREQELMELQGQIQQSATQKEQAVAERHAEMMAPILERVQNAIDKVSKARDLDLVLRAQAGQEPIILYVNEQTITDITMDVARELGLDVTDEEPTASAPGGQ